MDIFRNISLKKYNTFGLDYKADCLVVPESEDEIRQVLSGAGQFPEPFLVMGGGSNLLFISDYHGTIIKPSMKGIVTESGDNSNVVVSADAGVNWDSFVEWCVSNRFGGIENLSLIPGNVGAVPVQNIGAYGVEIKDHIEKVRTLRMSDGSVKEFNREECGFAYRNSVFKSRLKGQFLVTRVFFNLDLKHLFHLSYGLVSEEVKKLGSPSIGNIRQAVINIRKNKLPDPEIIGNAGSFFKNPVVDETFAARLREKYPSLPYFQEDSGDVKIAAGWLIEQCGWKGRWAGNVLIHEKQALVITNPGHASGHEIFEVSEKIRKSVLEKFSIDLEREVEVIGIT